MYSLVTLDSLIRPEYYGSRTILWVLHELKWLAPACGESGFSQKKKLKELIDHLLECNRQKAKSSLHPLTYTEVRTECFVFLDARVAMMCASGSAVDLYAGKPEATPSGKNGVSDTTKLKNEINSLRQKFESVNKRNNSPSGYKNKRKEQQAQASAKLSKVCRKYNTAQGCQGSCNFDHKCSKRLVGNVFCLSTNHAEFNHEEKY